MTKERLEQIIENVNRRNILNICCSNNTSKIDNEIMELITYIEELQQKYDKALEILENIYPPCEIDGFIDKNTEYCSLNCGVDEEIFKKCWDRFIEQKLEGEKNENNNI